MAQAKKISKGRVSTELIAGGWMVFVDGKKYLSSPKVLSVAESVAHNARLMIDRGFENQLHFGQ